MILLMLLAILIGGILMGIGFGSTKPSHIHDFYDYGENFTFIDRDGTSCALLFCGCGETRKIELNAFDDVDDYKKDIL